MEENTLISRELEEMRSQIGILKEKLDKQTIVNGMHIRNSMKSKASDMNRIIWGSIIAGMFALPYCTWFFWSQHLSVCFIIATAVMLAVCLGLTIAQQVTLRRMDFSQSNLVDVATKLNKVRTHYRNWWKTAIPLLTAWFAWLMYEIISCMGTGPYVIGFCCGVLVGGIIGGIIGFRINRKVICKANEILDQIEELQNGQE